MSRIAQWFAVVVLSACTVLPSAAAKAPAPKPATAARSGAAVAPAKPAAAVARTLVALLPRLEFRPEMIYATGEGAMPSPKEQPNRAKAYLQAKAYAKMQAIASLVQEIKGTIISYCSTGQGYVADAQIKQEIKGALECVRVVGTRKRAEGKDTIVEVTVAAPKPALPKLQPLPEPKPAGKASLPSWVSAAAGDSSNARPSKPEQAGAAQDNGFTSVIIDAQGLGVRKSMSPKILRPDGSEVWGTVKVDPDFLAEYGICAYARSRSEAFANRRAGDNPLVIRARSRGRSAAGSEVVISNSDADLLLAENARSGFLNEFRVIIIVDR